ncbi:MAG TPA: hypothetical protein VNT79_00320 [Phycisphaerae bacterium]|nr:hypothetical protein [Phycisphaerae bacterium]
MADHAPRSSSGTERLMQWVDDVTDARLSFYMFALATLVLAGLYLIDRSLF